MGIESAISSIVNGAGALGHAVSSPAAANFGQAAGPFVNPVMQMMGVGGGQSVPPPSAGAPMPQGHPSMPMSMGAGVPPPSAPVQAAGMMARQEPPSTGGPGMPRNLPPQVLQAMGMA